MVSLIYQELISSVDEQERILVVVLEYPASPVLSVYLQFLVLLVHHLLCQQLVILAVNLQVGLAVAVVDQQCRWRFWILFK